MQTQAKSQELIDAFTKNIEKIAVKVVIHTPGAVIIGEMHARPSLRLIDEIINGDQYVAITNADVYDKSSKARINTKFLILNREQIELLIPWEDIERKQE
jgi:hypothetical protein